MMAKPDVAIVGAGIAGISLAWHLHKAGNRVVVVDKSTQAEGASVRNFGMVWVVGQSTEDQENLALRSLELWEQAADEMGFWIRKPGSLHVAREPLELQVLEEFLQLSNGRHGRRMLSKEETLELCPQLRENNLLGSMHSATEGAVDPREVVHAAAESLSAKGVEFRFESLVTKIEPNSLHFADGTRLEAQKIVVCPGPELANLLPMSYQKAGLLQTHLQMMRLRPKEGIERIGIHLCSGLTLSHYGNFRVCPSLSALKDFHKFKWPNQVEHGIHILIAEHSDGTITLGDSHVYGRKGPVYQEDSIDHEILDACHDFFPLDNYEVTQRWMGSYNTHPTLPFWKEEVANNVWALNLFGTGMTLSFGVTEQLAQEIV
jgi:D-hydroxyproline dehydrogenase subunit beta